MPYVKIAADDPRTQLLAYVKEGRNLYEVVDDGRGVLVLEDCKTGKRRTIGRATIGIYTLVRSAPTAPDYPEQ